MLRGEYRDQVEWFGPDVDERVRYSSRYLCHVWRAHGKCLVAYLILRGALEQYVRLFRVMHMEPGAAARVRLGNDERHRLKP